MEEALEKCKGSEYVVFPILVFKNGGVVLYSDMQVYFMEKQSFLEMIFDMVSDNVPIDISNIYIELVDKKTAWNHLPWSKTFTFMDKYRVDKSYSYIFKSKTTLESILSTHLYNYIKDDYTRHMLQHNINTLKNRIKELIETQTSFDVVSEFERILYALE